MVVINGNVSGGIAVSKFARMVPLKYLCLFYQVVCFGRYCSDEICQNGTSQIFMLVLSSRLFRPFHVYDAYIQLKHAFLVFSRAVVCRSLSTEVFYMEP